MAYRHGNRYQMALLPKSIEDYVGPDDPVRAYDAFVDVLDFEGLGIEIDPVRGSMYNEIILLSHEISQILKPLTGLTLVRLVTLSMTQKRCSNY